MSDDFKDHPLSLAEVRAHKAKDSTLWTPHDALIAVLRDIDSGRITNVDALVVCFRSNNGSKGVNTHYSAAGPDVHTSLGLMEAVKLQMWQSSD